MQPFEFPNKSSFRSKFHFTGRDRLHINEKGIETAGKYVFDFMKYWIAS